MLTRARDAKIARKTIGKYYSDGITEFDSSVFELLFRADDDNDLSVVFQLPEHADLAVRLKSRKDS